MSPEVWNSLDENVRENIRYNYLNSFKIVLDYLYSNKSLNEHYKKHEQIVNELKDSFGEENLINETKRVIKTWSDLKLIDKRLLPQCGNPLINIIDDQFLINQINSKITATIKITKLINDFYGGVVTFEEWLDKDKAKYTVECLGGKINTSTSFTLSHPIAFHTREQRDEFLEHDENRQLVYDYYMMFNNERN